MAELPDGALGTYDEICERLDQIVADVRSKDTSLERSLDLFDEAIELGSRAVEMVDRVDYSEPDDGAPVPGAGEDGGAPAGEGA